MGKYDGHTPGPWNKIHGHRQIRIVPNMFSLPVATVGDSLSGWQANARLIADAPMLAEQNAKMLSWLNDNAFKPVEAKSITQLLKEMAELIAEMEGE